MERVVADERTPLTRNVSHTRFAITTGPGSKTLTHTASGDHSTSSTSGGGGGKRHKKHAMKKRHSQEFTAQARHELALLDQLTLPDQTRSQIDALVRDTLAMGELTCTLFAFHIVEGVFEAVREPEQWEATHREQLGEEHDISENMLHLVMRRFKERHFALSAALIHVQRRVTSPLHVIASRRRYTVWCKPDPAAPWNSQRRWFHHEKRGYYYVVLINFAQSEPMYELK